MLLDLVKQLLRTTAFHELAKISVLSITFQPVQFGFFYRSVNDCTFIAPTKRLYFYTLQTSNFILIRMLLDLVQPFLRIAVSLELAEISIH